MEYWEWNSRSYCDCNFNYKIKKRMGIARVIYSSKKEKSVMNTKKLLGVAVPVMLLFGCGVSEKTNTSKQEKTEESKVKESKSNSKKEKVSKEDYPNKVYKLGIEFDKLFAEHNNITREVFDGKKKKSDIVDSVKELNKTLDKFESIDPLQSM